MRSFSSRASGLVLAAVAAASFMAGSAVAERAPKQTVETLNFAGATPRSVTVIRGLGTGDALARGPRPQLARIETVRFEDPNLPPVTVVRGGAPIAPEPALFNPADGGDFARIAFAVDGVESRHGADPLMWRPAAGGPQGPMQVSAAAAFDVGGGDRFDLWDNRRLGRAYLARMFRRYGNWADALAAYNWGPGNLDLWIAAGRPADRLPVGVAAYVARVLRDALIGAARS